jgi:hypothetical protein
MWDIASCRAPSYAGAIMRNVNFCFLALASITLGFAACASSNDDKNDAAPKRDDAAVDAAVDAAPSDAAGDKAPGDGAVDAAPSDARSPDGPEVLPRPDATAPDVEHVEGGPAATMSFFITSSGSGAMGGNLGGLAGADAKCQSLATAVGLGNKTWHAYLSVSASGSTAPVNAKDRIGAGPWYNFAGIQIAANVAELHASDTAAPYLNLETALDEKGARVPGRGSPTPPGNQHDMLTGTQIDGTAYPASPDRTCAGWTSSAAPADAGAPADGAAADGGAAAVPTAQVGHFDRIGTGAPNHQSWNSAHATPGCDQLSIQRVGGAGRFYCFAIN